MVHPVLITLENTGAYTESISISPELIQICNINDSTNLHLLLKMLPTTVPVDTTEYHQSTSYLHRQS
jgi:hypothetical protein